jgi:hypothetical protein
MIDMSIGKLLLLAFIILVVWYGFKYAARVEAVRQTRRAATQRRGAGAGGNIGGGHFGGGVRAAAKPVEDLVKCRQCDAYVAAEGAANCGKPHCPWGA